MNLMMVATELHDRFMKKMICKSDYRKKKYTRVKIFNTSGSYNTELRHI